MLGDPGVSWAAGEREGAAAAADLEVAVALQLFVARWVLLLTSIIVYLGVHWLGCGWVVKEAGGEDRGLGYGDGSTGGGEA